MHEFSLLADLFKKIEAVAREHGADRATNVRIQLGALAHISAGHLREHFDAAKVGTAAEHAELEIFLTEEEHPQAQEIILESLELA